MRRLYCVLETFLVLWALGLALDAVFPCLLGDAVSKASLSSSTEEPGKQNAITRQVVSVYALDAEHASIPSADGSHHLRVHVHVLMPCQIMLQLCV